MYEYKIYFFDRDVNQQYPVYVKQNSMIDLCKWINTHMSKWNLELVEAYLLDKQGGYIDSVHFLPTEIAYQHCIVTLPERLIAYEEFMNGGV